MFTGQKRSYLKVLEAVPGVLCIVCVAGGES